ncbi:MAG TPA: type II CAAX endopeptidase family protein [Kofleriaceae bacterium]
MTSDACGFCGALFKPNAAFCSSCGQRRIILDEPSELRFVIKFYITMLAVMLPALIYVLHLDGDAFTTDLLASGGLLLVIFGFALARRPLWVPLYTTSGFGPLGFLIVLLAAPLVLGLVLGYVHGLSNAFGIHAPDELATFRDRNVLWMVCMIAVLPPLMEELAFRGVIYTGLRKTLGVAESFIISSFAFALLHMSLPALITHLPLGLYFCYLRYRSQSLWPAMFAHFLHNLGVIIVDIKGWA